MERAIVKVGQCRCPGQPHEEDWVGFTPHLDTLVGTSSYAAVREAGSDDVVLQGLLSRAFLMGIRSWSFVDADGDPIKVHPGSESFWENIERYLPWSNGGSKVVEFADGLYSNELYLDLASRSSKGSQAGPTVGSTSATQPSSPNTPEPSTPSSPTSSDGKQSEDPDR